ncbi:hypothetical protein DXT63_08365 [Thermoanaerobacteraceae bacterium SP2]|nr:hypothetical protein DXT63_08365 [Thermoanaerobacteraceae bacterium SP2]
MKKYKIANKKDLVSKRKFCYSKRKLKQRNEPNNRKEGDVVVAEITQKIQNLTLPPHIVRELGLSKDWKKDISPEFLEKIIKTAIKYKNVLKELSKY